MNQSEKYLFNQFEFSDQYRQQLIEFVRHQANVEIGGYKLFDGTGTHYMQNPVEITDLIFSLKKLEKTKNVSFKSFLEIGFSLGINNTFLNKFFQFSNIVAVDLLSDSGKCKDTLYANLRFKNISLICGNSRDKDTIRKVNLLGKYDLVFIDGGHEYETVKADFFTYKECLSDNGVIVLHDIAASDFPGPGKLWDELRNGEEKKNGTLQALLIKETLLPTA